ncbi:TetR/AcrR family transcriptional regulator [Rhodopseudomonas palustris]|uniref:TetR/AcrR family transcriptional regulator n=1 Tax=Rhodopseudomonas palustris TaxID=1076 RepID=UPI002ACE67B3|nr:TetR/AcrR family transcriptional regulator [Rhodopseudomonas palustris]WQH01770.1 TetR/AcrR family transcriptional regulator [Rhodopseudomonas palustris]
MSPEAKAQVRAAFVAAGRRLLATKNSEGYSLRAVAAAAGYSPGTIYQYFSDQRDLLFAIREQDMLEATIELERIAEAEPDTETRVRKLLLGAMRYWLDHFDHFETLFALAPSMQIVRSGDGVAFGRSAVVERAYAVFERAVGAFLQEHATPDIGCKAAVDCLLAAVHGMIWFPHATRTMDWTKTEPMIGMVIDAVLTSWKRAGTGGKREGAGGK